MNRPADACGWRDLAESLRPAHGAFINGQLVAAQDGRAETKTSPVDGKDIVDVAVGSQADIDEAVRVARQAFEDGRWSRLKPERRKQVLHRMADLLRARSERLAALITLDMGKPITDALDEVEQAATCLQYYAETIDKYYGKIAPTPDEFLTLISHEALGVVGVVVPWNWPLSMPCWKVGPALAMGNSVVLKPSERAPLVAIELAVLGFEAGVPPGVFNVVPGRGESAGAALGLHDDVDKVTFTGSAAVGRRFLQYAGESNMKRVSLECGGKAPIIILDDVTDLGELAPVIARGAYLNQGESCTAATRIYVPQRLAKPLSELLVECSSMYQPADPFEPSTAMGALVDEAHLCSVLNHVAQARVDGASLLYGGDRVLTETGGSYVEPTILEGVRDEMRISSDEVFGPVLCLSTVSSEEEAVRRANNSIYGLSASVWTNQLSRAHEVARRLRAGNVFVNCYDVGDMSTPFGGFKQSGIGVDKSMRALDKYVTTKSTWIRLR